jgi:DNA repair protein RadC
MKNKTDHELLELILKKQFDRVAFKTLREIAEAHPAELGLTELAYDRLMAGIELGKRVSEPKTNYMTTIGSSHASIEFCKAHFARLISEGLQEEFHIVTLNTKNRVIGTHLITIGTLDASLVHPREVFRKAIKDASSSVILVHNHPSGDPTPSREDFAVTNRLTEAGKLIGIDVLDHIVLGREGCRSVRELE